MLAMNIYTEEDVAPKENAPLVKTVQAVNTAIITVELVVYVEDRDDECKNNICHSTIDMLATNAVWVLSAYPLWWVGSIWAFGFPRMGSRQQRQSVSLHSISNFISAV